METRTEKRGVEEIACKQEDRGKKIRISYSGGLVAAKQKSSSINDSHFYMG